MSIRRQTTAQTRGSLASVFALWGSEQLFFGIYAFFGGLMAPWACPNAYSQSNPAASNGVPASIPSVSTQVITPRTNRPVARPRPAFWQGDMSLTEEQRAAIRESNQAFRKENQSLLGSVTRLNRELEEAVFAIPADKSAIQAKAAELGAAEGQLAVARSQLIAKLRLKLTPEQLERLKSLRGSYELAERFTTVPGATNHSAGTSRPRKREAESNASGSPKPKE